MIAGLLLTATILLGASAGPEEQLIDRVVAIVDGRPILASELGGEDAPEAVNRLIERLLLQAEARRRGIAVEDRALDDAIAEVRQRNKIPDLATLQRAVQASGRTWSQYRRELREQLLEQRLMAAIMSQGTQVTDAELERAIARDAGLLERRRARHLLLRLDPGAADWEISDAAARCQALLERIQAGADFAAVASENSEDPSASRGGALGVFGRGVMDPAFEKAVFSAEVGLVVGPIRSAFGFHLILVDEVLSGAKDPQAIAGLRMRLRRRNAAEKLRITLAAARRRALVKFLPK
jgi:parvulin-like peptidyl-prolyl isomerase